MRYFNRSKTRLYVHFVWTTKNKMPVITPEIERSLYRCITTICEKYDCKVLAINGMPDHVHLLVILSAKISVADLMKHVKGGSSRFVSSELLEAGWFDWQNHYGAFTISARDKERLISYIQNQKQHHADGTLIPSCEETEEEAPESNE